VKKNWGRTVAIFGAITGRKLSVREALLLMVAAKLAREFNRPKRDNIRDAIGYLVLYDEVKGGAK